VNRQWVEPNCGTTRIFDGFDSTTNEFIGCVFSNIHSGDVSGGVIYLSSSTILSISFDLCVFHNTSVTKTSSSYRGGGIYIESVKRVRIESTSFDYTSGGNGGGISIHLSSSTSECVLIHNCSLQNSYYYDYGGGIDLRSYSILPASCSNHSIFGTLFGCFFFNCSSSTSSAWGGGLYIYSPPEKGCVRSCVFHLCKTTSSIGRGGGIYFSSLPSTMSDDTILYFSLFDGNEASNGKDIYITTSLFFILPLLFLLFNNIWIKQSKPSRNN
jgi:hypothetical protein